MSKQGWFRYDADDAFHIEKHVDGLVYGPEALLSKLKMTQEGFFKNSAEKDETKAAVSNFDLIRNQLLSRRADVSFDKALLATLTQSEKAEVEEMLIREILGHNHTCYQYIDCLSSVKKINRKFIATLTGTSRYEVLKGIYLVNRRRWVLYKIAKEAYKSVFCFDLLVDIYSRTKEAYIHKIITRILSRKRNDKAYEFVVQTRLTVPEKKQIKTGGRQSKSFYLSKDNQITDAENAHKRVIQVFEDGVLVDEVWSFVHREEEPVIHDTELVYVDESGREVPQEKATAIIFKTLKDGKVISETRYELKKPTPRL